MKLWLLRPVDKLPAKDNPWEAWYDSAFGFVVRADSENAARQIANDNAGDENAGRCYDCETPWLNAKYSSCIELTADGDAGCVIVDFVSA